MFCSYDVTLHGLPRARRGGVGHSQVLSGMDNHALNVQMTAHRHSHNIVDVLCVEHALQAAHEGEKYYIHRHRSTIQVCFVAVECSRLPGMECLVREVLEELGCESRTGTKMRRLQPTPGHKSDQPSYGTPSRDNHRVSIP